MTSFKIVDSLAIKTQLPACPILTNPLSARNQFRQEPLDDSPQAAARRPPQSRSNGHPALHCLPGAESLEGGISGHPSYADIVAACCLPKFPRDQIEMRNKSSVCSFGKQAKFMSLLEEFLGSSIRDLHAGEKEPRSHTDEQRGRRACALTARGSISKAMKGLVGGAAQGPADCRIDRTTALIPRSFGFATHPTSTGCAQAACVARSGGPYKAARGNERARAQQNRYCLTPGTPEQRRRLFRGLDIPTIKWAIDDLPEECRFILNMQLMFFEEKDPTTKLLDDDEWVRFLTETQEITADVPEESVTCDQQAVDLQKVQPIQMGEFLRKCVSRRLLALSEGELQPSLQQCDSRRRRGPRHLIISSTMNGLQDPFQLRWPESKWMKKLFWNDSGVQCAKERVIFLPITLQRQVGNTVPCPTLSKTDSHRCPKTVQGWEMLTVPSSAVSLLGWLQPEHDCVLPPNRPHAPSLGLVSMTHWKNNGFRQCLQAKCRRSNIFNWVDQQNTSELMICDTLYQKTEAW